MKHTPGPCEPWGDNKTLIAKDDGKMMVGEAFHTHSVQEWSRTLGEAQANARLWAAAPDMLEALELTVNHWTSQFEKNGHMAPEWVKKARAAIEKAKGNR